MERKIPPGNSLLMLHYSVNIHTVPNGCAHLFTWNCIVAVRPINWRYVCTWFLFFGYSVVSL